MFQTKAVPFLFLASSLFTASEGATIHAAMNIKPENKEQNREIAAYKALRGKSKAPKVAPPSPEARIVGGGNASPGEYQYYVQLIGDFVCGGSLIAPNVVLTAAHCDFVGLNYVSVGNYYLTFAAGIELGDSQHSAITNRAIHPGYDASGVSGNDHDLMLLKLDERFTELQLTKLNDDSSKPRVGQDLTVIGHGMTEHGTFAPILKELDLEVKAPSQCFPHAFMNEDVNQDTEFCAGGLSDESACGGDSGGPIFEVDPVTGGMLLLLLLLLFQSQRTSLFLTPFDASSLVKKLDHIQMGVVAWTFGECNEPGHAEVFSRVESSLDWIKDTVCDTFGVTDVEFCDKSSAGESNDEEVVESDDEESDTLPPDTFAPTFTFAPTNPPTGSGNGNPEGSEECDPREIYIYFEIQTDAYGSETSWDIQYANGVTMFSDSGFMAGELRKYDGCISSQDGCYFLSIYDSFGDGMPYPHGGVEPYVYIVFGNDSYRGTPDFTTDVTFKLCPQ